MILVFMTNTVVTISHLSLSSSTNKTERHDITEILLKVALNTIILTKPEAVSRTMAKIKMTKGRTEN
jgi:hypothetical protein